MDASKKSKKALAFVADAELIRFVSEQAKKKPTNSLVQLLNVVLKLPRKDQDIVWYSVFMMLWSNAPQGGVNMTKAELIDAIASSAKLTKADAGRLIGGGVKGGKVLIDAISAGAKLTKADAG